MTDDQYILRGMIIQSIEHCCNFLGPGELLLLYQMEIEQGFKDCGISWEEKVITILDRPRKPSHTENRNLYIPCFYSYYQIEKTIALFLLINLDDDCGRIISEGIETIRKKYPVIIADFSDGTSSGRTFPLFTTLEADGDDLIQQSDEVA